MKGLEKETSSVLRLTNSLFSGEYCLCLRDLHPPRDFAESLKKFMREIQALRAVS